MAMSIRPEPTVKGEDGHEFERQFLLLSPPDRAVLGTAYRINQVFLDMRVGSASPLAVVVGKKAAHSLQAVQGTLNWCAALPEWAYKRVMAKAHQLRLRKESVEGVAKYSATVKSGGRLSRREWNCNAAPWMFELSLPCGKKLDKTRYLVQEDKLIQVDFFEGILEGGVIAEIEYGSEAEAMSHAGPQQLGPWVEITWEPRFRQRKLMKNGRVPLIYGPVVTIPSSSPNGV